MKKENYLDSGFRNNSILVLFPDGFLVTFTAAKLLRNMLIEDEKKNSAITGKSEILGKKKKELHSVVMADRTNIGTNSFYSDRILIIWHVILIQGTYHNL